MILPQRILIVGLGQLGTSIGRALIENAYGGEIVGWDRERKHQEIALKREAIHRLYSFTPLDETLVVLSVPVREIPVVLHTLQNKILESTILTDTGSVKGWVMESVKKIVPYPRKFVGGHPIAGREISGPDGMDPFLFMGKPWILVPPPKVDSKGMKWVRGLVEKVGAIPVTMNARQHDEIYACLSHLPHLFAFALLDFIKSSQHFSLGGPLFKEVLRVAGSDPKMWGDIFITNEREVRKVLKKVVKGMEKLLPRPGREKFLYQNLKKISEKARKFSSKQ
jgi:prephenate dehydrogenase